jgi:hypothetical protein
VRGFESGLAIAGLFAHHFHIHMPIILLVRKAPLRVARQGIEFLKEMQGLEKSRVKFWKLSRSMKNEMGC